MALTSAPQTSSRADSSIFRRYAPLLFLAAVEGAWCVFLAATRSIPRGHDGFQYFYLKYYFFNDFVRNGEMAEWLPYLTHGSPSAWWYVVQSGIFDPIVLFAARLLQLSDFIPVFYALLFFEKLLLILGTWLLAAEHFRSRPAVFAVTAVVTTTSIWYTQVWWNFHAILALPMMLFLLHRAIFGFQWKWLVGLSLLLYLQTFGHLSYYLPMTLLFLAAYAGQLMAQPEARAALWGSFRFNAAGALTVSAVSAAFLLELLWLQRSSREIAFVSGQRGANGMVSLETFLNYGGNTDLRAWNQFFSGLTPHLDFTLFAGFLVAGLAIVAVSAGRLDRVQKRFFWLTAMTVLVAAGSPIAVFTFYFWPLGGLFRHLALLVPAAKLFCTFLSGATLDRLASEAPLTAWPTRTVVAATAALGGWFVLLMTFALYPANLQSFLAALTAGTLPAIDDYARYITLQRLLRGAAFVALSWIALVALLRGTRSQARTTRLAWAAALVLFADVSTYAVQEMRARTMQIPEREAALFRVTDLPYLDQRPETPEDTDNPRRRTFSKALAQVVGTRYWSESLLWLTDTYRTSQRTVFWSTALESFLDALRRRPGLETIGTSEILALPTDDALLTALAGFRESKVRFFTRAILCPDVESTGALLAQPAYRGQAALLTGSLPLETRPSPASPPPRMVDVAPCEASALTMDDAQPDPRPSSRSVAFTSNRAEFDVVNPTPAPLVMTYSDSWGEHWRARIDDIDAPVLRSNLAYKAVVVPPGSSRVVFEYADRMAEAVFESQRVASLGLLVFLGILIAQLKREPAGTSRTLTGSSSSTT